MAGKLLLIDGHSILFRAFYGIPLTMTAPDGTHTNAVYGFINILGKMLDEEKPDYLAVAFDLPEPTFRHEMYPEYKGTRGPSPDEFREQVPVIRGILEDMEIPVVTLKGYEADDILGTLASKAQSRGIKTALVSGDRDLLQISDELIDIIIPKTKGGQTTYERYAPADVKEAYGVTPAGFIELKALMGDSSDNVPGLPGVGPKTAQKILETYGTIENAAAHAEEIKPKKAMEAMRDHYDLLKLSLDLVTIKRDAPVEFDEDRFRVGDIYNNKVYEDFKRLGMKSFLSRFDEVKPAALPEDGCSVISGDDECGKIFEEASLSGDAGLCVIAGRRIYAAAVAYGNRVFAAVPGGDLHAEELEYGIRKLLDTGSRIACTDAKQLIKMYPLVDEGRLFDCVIAAYLLDPLKSDWTYDTVSAAHVGRTVPSETEILGKKGLAGLLERLDRTDRMEDEDAQNLSKYAVLIAGTSLAAAAPLTKKLSETEMLDLFRDVEMPLTYVLASMERTGILASREELAGYGMSLQVRIDELTKSIYERADEEFNINSPKQLGQILFEKMLLPGGKKTKTGYSTAADVLEKLAPKHPIVAEILEYRTLSKLKSTYADGLAPYIDEDGRIRTSFKQTVTATGRLSSADPNLQNIPMREELGRLIRKCFYPREGCLFVDADYSQIELRILAHMSGDEKLIDAYRQSEDIHRITASQVFHVPLEDVTDEMRRNAKAVNFGIVYGQSSFGLSQGLSITRKEAEEYINSYFETYPKIKAFLDHLVLSAKEKGYAVSLLGRRRPIPELRSANFMQRSFGERAAMNSPIQGTAADIMKIAMVKVYKRLKKELPEADLILQIHDELLVEVPAEKAEEARRIISEEMEGAVKLKVDLITDSHIGADWYDAK